MNNLIDSNRASKIETSLAILFFLITISCFAQQQITAITYKIARKNSEEKSDNPKFGTMLNQMNKQFENLEYLLLCDSESSVYKIIDKLGIANENPMYSLAAIMGGSGIYYKNTKDKLKLVQTTNTGQKINIIHDLNEYDWKIGNETKKIGDYLCYKATSEIKEFNYIKNKEMIYRPHVWFTYDIPLPFGPKGFDGLPGLVLEAAVTEKIILFANNIDFNYEGKETISEPTGGKEVTKEEYNLMTSELHQKP